MLIVTRRVQQSVIVENLAAFEGELKVRVLGVRDGSVRLGFEVIPAVPDLPGSGAEGKKQALEGPAAVRQVMREAQPGLNRTLPFVDRRGGAAERAHPPV